ncbi:MAG: AAA family ATPase [Oscillospiraceae bacterium]|nr:AAA family ATPase [Oscillospiraceae bacterium]
MGTAIVITSGKGGTGKTTSTAALSAYLASMGSRVLCVDADAGLKNLDLCLGMASCASAYDYGDVLAGRCGAEQAVSGHPDIPGLYLMSAPVEQGAAGLPELIAELKSSYDYCIIDCPAGIGSGFREACGGADSAIIVSASDPSSCRDSGRVVQELSGMGIKDCRLIINRVRRGVLRVSGATLDDAIDSIGARLLGYVPDDRNVILAAMNEQPLSLWGKGQAAEAYKRIAMRMLGKKVPIG